MAHKVKCISYLIQAFSPLQPVWLWSHSFSLQPNFAFLTTNMFPLNSDWIAPDRCVRWQERRATYCYVRYHPGQGKLEGWGWEVNIFDGDPTPLLRQELKQFDALIGGCWYTGLVPYHEQMLHISSSAHQITPSHDILSIMSCTSQTYLVGWVTGIHFIMMEYERSINFTF